MWVLEKESFTRKSFCIVLSEYIPRLNYMSKIEIEASKLKRHTHECQSHCSLAIRWLGERFSKRSRKTELARSYLDSERCAWVVIVQSLNSPFLPPCIGVEPRRAKKGVQDNLHAHARNEPIRVWCSRARKDLIARSNDEFDMFNYATKVRDTLRNLTLTTHD